MPVRALVSRARRILRRIDPNDDPTAEPLSLLAVLVVLALTAFSTFMFLRWKVQPMQDLGHHLAMTAVVADYGSKGSIYPAIYKPFDPLNTNSLLYTVAGYAGRIFPVSWTFRLAMASYVAGVPLANLWALRVFGRSAWGAVIAVPLVYSIQFVYGFANFLFAAPLLVLSIPLFYRMIVKPTPKRAIAVAVVTTLVFLAHVHVFLWMGVLLFLMTLAAVLVTAKHAVLGRPGPSPLVIASAAALSVTPSLALFGRWLHKSTRPPAPDEFLLPNYNVGATSFASYREALRPPSSLVIDFYGYVKPLKTEEDIVFLLGLVFVLGVSVAIARMHTWKRPPVMELAATFTLASYFVIPEHWAGQAVIGSRHIGMAFWLVAASFAPVPGRVTRLGRAFNVVGTTWLAVFALYAWNKHLVQFETEEAAGLEDVIRAAPPRKRLHYVNIGPTSKRFSLNSFWHAEKWYMVDKLGQCNENPAYGVMNAIHYRAGFEPHRVTHHENDWPAIQEIWDNFDLVLVHHWHPSTRDLFNANQHGELVKASGDWELWRSKDAK